MKYLKTILCILCIQLSGCLKDGNIKLGNTSYTPESTGDGWVVATAGEVGFDEQEITAVYEDFYSEDLYPAIHSLLIVKDGKLVGEAYCRDPKGRDRPHHLQSATKSITSLLMGMAIDKGLVDSVGESIYNYLPDFGDNDPDKEGITIHHVLTMETGLEFDNDIHTVKLYNHKGNSLEYVLTQDLEFFPGSDWHYHDGNPHIISGIIREVTGMSLNDFAFTCLFDPLGINDYRWEEAADGLTFGAFGLWMKPRDMAKIGLMLVNDGIWEGQQIVSTDWIEKSTKKQTPFQEYGYYWYPWVETGGYFAEGHGGQLIYIFPSFQIVIVITADPYSNSYILQSRFYELVLGILNAQ